MAQPSLIDNTTCRSRRVARQRRGLAPLEFVLWLPILLFVAALMLNFGTAAAWRLRGEVISRDAAWRVRTHRKGHWESPPEHWPDGARMGTEHGPQVSLLDDERIDHPVVRGPLENGFEVRPHLDPDHSGGYRGIAEVEREYPLLPRMGRYESGEIVHPMLDHKWPNWAMGIPNNYRRVKALYRLPKTEPSLPAAFEDAVIAVATMPNYADLRVLDRDEDIRKYQGGYVDFHPRVNRNRCELDVDVVREREVERLVDIRNEDGEIELRRISYLPRTMTNYFLNMYRSARDRMEAQIEALQMELSNTPPPTPQRAAQIAAQIANLQAEIAIISPKIDQLEAYQARLRQIEAMLEQRANAAI